MVNISAALVYFLSVFATGFVLGIIRVLVLLPRLGVRSAELLEMPLMLIVIVLTARTVNRRFLASATALKRLGTGLAALSLLLVAEVALGVWVRGLSVTQSLFDRDPVSGTVYYVMLAVFGLAPWLLSRIGTSR